MATTEKNLTSSMTSVTEEETSVDSESDTTESYSNLASSTMTSTDYNTDDKLTPGLNSIKISKSRNASNERVVETKALRRSKSCQNPFPLQSAQLRDSRHSSKSGAVKNSKEESLFKQIVKQSQRSSKKRTFTSMEENLGVDDPENKLSTDFSDTSSRFDEATLNGPNSQKSESEEENYSKDDEETCSPFFPNMSSGSWYEARCFDFYWTNYHFVMKWYRQHVQAVTSLMSGTGRGRARPQGQHFAKVNRTRRKSQKARKRHKESACHSNGSSRSDGTSSRKRSEMVNDRNGESMEMEITDDMMAFFAKSLKHRMERDTAKTDEELETTIPTSMDSIQVGKPNTPSLSAPKEQPGVRRTAEMRKLYGSGAAMVHGMETALQMTFDRFTDRFQPKLWPNMPLNFVFQ